MTDTSVADLGKSVQAMTEQVLKGAISQTDAKLTAMVNTAEKKIESLYGYVPIMTIKIGETEKQKLSSRAVPYLERLVINSKLGLNTLLVGPAGCGKTTAGKQLGEALGLQFGSVCLTAGASETWLFGRQTPNGFVEGAFSKLYKEGGVFLADEMDAADANLLLSINTALANNWMFNPMNGETIEKHKDFVFIGAANTFGKGADHVYTGRSRLDGATLDRFVVITVDYDAEYEKICCPMREMRRFLGRARQALKDHSLDEFVSTRWFDYSFRMYEAGISIKEIRDSLRANWCEEARRLCNTAYHDAFDGAGVPDKKGGHAAAKKKANQRHPGEIPF